MACTGTEIQGFLRKYAGSLNRPDVDQDLTLFHVTITLGSAGTDTTVIADGQIPSGQKLFVTGWAFTSDGAAWADGTNIILQDTNGTPIVLGTVLTANLPTDTAGVGMTGGTNFGTLTAGQGMITGLTAGKGLRVTRTGTFTGAAIVKLHVWGFLKTDVAETY